VPPLPHLGSAPAPPRSHAPPRYHAEVARALRRFSLWAVATGLAVLVSWFGVRLALPSEAAKDAARTVPVDRLTLPSPSHAPGASGSPAPMLVPTSPPAVSPASAGPSAGAQAPSGAGASGRPAATAALATGAAGETPVPPPASAGAAADGAEIQSYELTGGRVVLAMTAASARLVSATPDAGWRVQAWQAEGWLRVDFSRDGTTSSCFVTWNGHPPSVQTT